MCHDLVVKLLVSQLRGPGFKTIGWLQGFSSFQGWSNEYQELLRMYWMYWWKGNYLLLVALQPWDSWGSWNCIHKKRPCCFLQFFKVPRFNKTFLIYVFFYDILHCFLEAAKMMTMLKKQKFQGTVGTFFAWYIVKPL